jgi:hypothetical protein
MQRSRDDDMRHAWHGVPVRANQRVWRNQAAIAIGLEKCSRNHPDAARARVKPSLRHSGGLFDAFIKIYKCRHRPPSRR